MDDVISGIAVGDGRLGESAPILTRRECAKSQSSAIVDGDASVEPDGNILVE